MSSPLLIPPCTPPELFVLVRIFPSRISNGSLCCEPRIRVAAKPEPISKPLVAGMLSIAFARSASNLSKTGSPRPEAMPRATHSITPPIESPLAQTSSISDIIRFAAAASGQRTIFFSTRGEFALTRATAIQLSLNIRFRNVDARRAAVDHNADAAAMRLTKGGDAKKLAECIAHLNQKSKRDPSDL